MWVPDEGRHTGTPSLPTYGVPPLTCLPTPQYITSQFSWMTTGQMTCASGADDVFLPPFRKLRFQMINNTILQQEHRTRTVFRPREQEQVIGAEVEHEEKGGDVRSPPIGSAVEGLAGGLLRRVIAQRGA